MLEKLTTCEDAEDDGDDDDAAVEEFTCENFSYCVKLRMNLI